MIIWMRRIALGVFLMAPGASLAADVQGNFSVKGTGQAPCKDYVIAASSKGQQAAPFLNWLAGYLSAANQYESQTYDMLSWQTDNIIALSLLSYCRANPKTPFALAAAKMVNSLRPSRVTRKGPFQILTVGKERIRLHSETILRIKSILQARAGYAGPMTAVWDKAAVQSLARFQAGQKLQATGQLDPMTLAILLAPSTKS
jgi:hypothetical protein